MQEGRKIAEQVLEENKSKLIEIVNFLNKHEVMTEENLQQILGEKAAEESWPICLYFNCTLFNKAIIRINSSYYLECHEIWESSYKSVRQIEKT